MANKQKQSKIRLEIDWQPFPNSSRFAPTFTEGNNDLQEGCYFEHVDAGFVVDDFLRRNVRLLQAEDIDSDQLWFRIAGNYDGFKGYIFDRFALFLKPALPVRIQYEALFYYVLPKAKD